VRKVSTLAACLIAVFLGTAAAVVPHVAHATGFCSTKEDVGKVRFVPTPQGALVFRCAPAQDTDSGTQLIKRLVPCSAASAFPRIPEWVFKKCPTTPPTTTPPSTTPPTTEDPTDPPTTTAPPTTGGGEPAPAQPVDEQPSFTG
jgi:hypothetical protein